MLNQTKALLAESHNNLDVAINSALDRKARAQDEETEELYISSYYELLTLRDALREPRTEMARRFAQDRAFLESLGVEPRDPAPRGVPCFDFNPGA